MRPVTRADGGAGETYVVFGKDTETDGDFAASIDLASLDGTNGFTLTGIDGGDGSGLSVSSAGDVNGDGIDDILIGAYGADGGAGETYLVYGGTDILERFDAADGVQDGTIDLANIGMDPADVDLIFV